jgi:hypothetical protein
MNTGPAPFAPAPNAAAQPWLARLVLGLVLGGVILGAGGRLAMRGITLWEERAHQFTPSGTLNVIAFGCIFGILGAALRLLLDALLDRWPIDWRSTRARDAAFALLCLALGVLILTPLTIHRLVLFLPLIVLYIVALERGWRRVAAPALP